MTATANLGSVADHSKTHECYACTSKSTWSQLVAAHTLKWLDIIDLPRRQNCESIAFIWDLTGTHSGLTWTEELSRCVRVYHQTMNAILFNKGFVILHLLHAMQECIKEFIKCWHMRAWLAASLLDDCDNTSCKLLYNCSRVGFM